MRKSVVLSTLGLFLCLSLSTYAATYGGGNGTAADPYRIYTAEQMNTIGLNSGDWGKCFKLMADIDMSAYTGTQYNIIGRDIAPFTGTFDGNNHKISNLTYHATTLIDYVGLFGYTSNATITNLGVKNVNLYSLSTHTGGLAACQNYGTITNCYSTGLVTASASNAASFVGGLVGYQYGGAITNCYNTGAVTASASNASSYAGGLVGSQTFGTITNCYSTGAVTTSAPSFASYAGGLVGLEISGSITTCYAAGTVSNGTYAGGLVGSAMGSFIISGSFWDKETTGKSIGLGSGTSTGVTGKTTAEMKTLSTFTNAGWDFVTTDGDGADWWMPANSYPSLEWNHYGGGSGTAADPYRIYTAEQMNTIGANSGDWGKCFKLTADIDMSAYTGTQYNIIGNDTTKFTGTFDGNGHVISNLTYSTTAAVSYVGLIGYTNSAMIKDLGVENVNLYTGGSYVGGLAGYQSSGTITNCYSTGSLTSTSSSDIGGLVGDNFGGTITNCYSTGAVTSTSIGDSFAGGLAGYLRNGTITNCRSTGSVTASASDSYAGGLVGNNFGGTITHCHSTGAVSSSASSTSYAGGLVGYQGSGTITNCYSTGTAASFFAAAFSSAGGLVGEQYGGIITNCYSTGAAISSSTSTAPSYAGGLAGYSSASIEKCYSTGPVYATGGAVYKGGLLGYKNGSGTTAACFWDTQTSGQSIGVGSGTTTGVTGKTTVQMRTLSTFTGAGWNFTADWQMPASGYPYPAWKLCSTYPAGDINQDCQVDMTDLAILSAHWLEGV